MRQEERLSLILEHLSQTGSVGVSEIAAELGVSTASVRRDLQLLEEQHLLSRTHGGAVANATVYELPLRYRSGSHKGEKRRIAAVAAERVDDTVATVGMTGGTTTTEVARRLADRAGPDRRHQRPEHRLGPGAPPRHQADRHRRHGAQRVLRAGRPAGRVDPGRPEPRHRRGGRRRHLGRRRPHDLSRSRGGHQPRHDRQGPAGDRRGRRLQGRQAGAGAHLRRASRSTS